MNLPVWFFRRHGGVPPDMSIDEYLAELRYAMVCAASTWSKSGGASFMTYAVRAMFFVRKQCWQARRLANLSRTVSLDDLLKKARKPPGAKHDWKSSPVEWDQQFSIEDRDELDSMLDKLHLMTPRQARVMSLWLKGMSLRKVAKRLRMTHQGASNLFLRGIERIQKRMGIYKDVAGSATKKNKKNLLEPCPSGDRGCNIEVSGEGSPEMDETETGA